jgi:hypothetical protein
VLSIVARRRAVRARGSLDVRRWQALIQGQGCRGASLADVCSTMSSSHSWGQVSSVASQSFGAMGFSLICVFRKGRGLGLVRLFFFSRVLCSSLVERLFSLCILCTCTFVCMVSLTFNTCIYYKKGFVYLCF